MSEIRIIDTPSLFKIDDSFNDERFMRVRIAVMHSGINLNKSSFSTSVIKKAKGSFANIPILANVIITTDENGEKHLDYGSHDMHIEDDVFNDGKQRIIYDEKIVGLVPESNNFEIIYDEASGNDYVWVDALIYRDYGNYCADILESRGGTTAVSAEIACNEISYDAKNNVIQVDEMEMCAITLLGETVNPGMAKAHATVFSIDHESREKQIFDIIQELKQSLEKYIATYSDGNYYERKEEPMKKKSEKEIKDTPSVVHFDEPAADGGIDYYEPEEEQGQEQEAETDGESEPTGNDDPVVTEPSPEDVAAAEEVTDAIDALTNSSTAEAVSAARSAYEALSDDGKSLVTPETLAKLEAQEVRISNQEAADAVTALITALTDSSSAEDVASARTAYEALTSDQKAYVTAQTLALLEKQEAIINKEAADAVTDSIEALTDESTAAEIEAARQAYDALTDAQKELVSAETLALLEEQEERISNEGSTNDDQPKKKKKVNNELNIEYSVKCKGKVKTSYATLSEKLMSLTNLVNATYGDIDGGWYCVDADEDKKVVYMHDYWADKHYRQSYIVKKEVYTLVGDRVETFARYLTQDEINEFEKMKGNYSVIESELKSHKEEPEKKAILSEACYEQISDTEAFKKLSSVEAHFSMSVDEVRAEADRQLLDYAHNHELKFSTQEPKKNIGMKLFGNPMKRSNSGRSRYGGLHKKEN